MHRLILSLDECTLCGECVHACPLSIFTLEGKIVLVEPHRCNQCLRCVEVCPASCFTFSPAHELIDA
ncbi:Ferredoxin [Giardia muris]|uniref:Ferredoxin n=1 Tax=Giardia muris TaxID=5742 RepID=A0A3S7RND1_GIAMU|nr:Ferredoxin [Giardia muris]TNJ28501.1 Ferredoxin [Giardia muris]|eukprot:TNJ28501.1 Ferredoxin [Giardia muris]